LDSQDFRCFKGLAQNHL